MSDLRKANEEIAEAVTGGFQKIEDGVVGGYKKLRVLLSAHFRALRTNLSRAICSMKGKPWSRPRNGWRKRRTPAYRSRKRRPRNAPQNKRRESRPVSIPAGRNGPPAD